MVEYVKISNLKEGDVLARTLYDAEMRVMLKNGNKLSANGIRVIKEQGYRGIYIQHEDNGFRQDVPLAEPLVDEMTQLQMISLIKEIFQNQGLRRDSFDKLFQKQRQKMEEYIEQIITIFQNAQEQNKLLLEIKDNRSSSLWIYYHSLSTCFISLGMGIKFGFPKAKLKELGFAAVFHDLGKAFLGSDLLYKKNITEDERKLLREHPTYVFRIMQRLQMPVDISYGIWQHHEHIDGSGYPNGIKGDKMVVNAKIIALASLFDNYVNAAPYSTESYMDNEAIEKLYGISGFDKTCIKALLMVVVPYPVGTKVKLSNGNEALVMRNVVGMPLRPIIVIGHDYINLAQDENYRNVTITDVID